MSNVEIHRPLGVLIIVVVEAIFVAIFAVLGVMLLVGAGYLLQIEVAGTFGFVVVVFGIGILIGWGYTPSSSGLFGT